MLIPGNLVGRWKTSNGSEAIIEGKYQEQWVGKVGGVIHYWNDFANCDYDHGYDLMERLMEGNYPPIHQG